MKSDGSAARRQFKEQLEVVFPILLETARFMYDGKEAERMVGHAVEEAYLGYDWELKSTAFNLMILGKLVRANGDLAGTQSEGLDSVNKGRKLQEFVASAEGHSSDRLRSRLRQEVTRSDLLETAHLIPSPIRSVLALFIVARLTASETAEVLGVSIAVVRSRLRKGRRLMSEAVCERLLRRPADYQPGRIIRTPIRRAGEG